MNWETVCTQARAFLWSTRLRVNKAACYTVVTFRISIRSLSWRHQHLAELFSFNSAISHLNEACHFDEPSRGSILGYEILLVRKKVRYALAKSSCVLCFCPADDDGDHGIRRANTAQALARWRHLGASREATKMFRRAMWLAPYYPGGMVVRFVVKSATFLHCW